RHSTGEGQYVDVSAQHSQIPGMLNAVGFWELQGNIMRREGCFRTGIGTIPQRQTWPCKDGFVTFVIMGGAFGARTNRALIEWMDEEAMADDFLKKIDWDTFDMGAATSEDLRHMMEYFGRFFTGHTKERLYNEGIKRRIMIYPVSSPRDLVACLQLKGRSFWVDVEHPYLDDVIAVPGSFGLGSESSPSIRCCAPLIGEHNEEVYLQELNFSREEVIMLKEGKII
ncbi:MAG: CoA transferase, partial [Chloroflexota bacterium]|nr:CoA transferase [Chloroflexota bacterium]